MTYIVQSSPRFLRRASKFFRKHPELEPGFNRIVEQLLLDPSEPSLRLHPLRGKFEGQYALSLSYAYRTVLTLAVVDRVIVLIDIGTHDEVYA